MKEQFIEIVSEQLKRPLSESDLNVSLDKLEIDSLDMMDIIMAVEDKLGVQLDTSNIPPDCTLQDLMDSIGN